MNERTVQRLIGMVAFGGARLDAIARRVRDAIGALHPEPVEYVVDHGDAVIAGFLRSVSSQTGRHRNTNSRIALAHVKSCVRSVHTRMRCGISRCSSSSLRGGGRFAILAPKRRAGIHSHSPSSSGSLSPLANAGQSAHVGLRKRGKQPPKRTGKVLEKCFRQTPAFFSNLKSDAPRDRHGVGSTKTPGRSARALQEAREDQILSGFVAAGLCGHRRVGAQRERCRRR
jgi:hypothetical protein